MKVPAVALDVLRDDAEVVAAYLFGSRAAERQRVDSDWDFAVLWSDDVPRVDRFRRRMRLMETLEHVLGVRVDVLDLRSTGVLLAAQAVRGDLLFDRAPAVRATFEMRLWSQEDDERIALRWQRGARRQR
jgi:uncharacterized protein